MTVHPGKIIALDVGDVRVGVAASDPTGLLASPVTIIRRGPDAVDQIVKIIRDSDASAVVVGLPLNMDGTVGFQAKKVQRFAAQIEAVIAPISVIMEDERESTVDARELRIARGTRKKKRRDKVDAEAAAVFLQAYLDRVRESARRSES